MPCFNAEDTLYRCMDAVQSLEYPKEDLEVIIINNGSTDRTYRIATGYDVRVIGKRRSVKYSEIMSIGAKNSNFENLLFVDQKTVVRKDVLNSIKNLDYSPVVSGELNIDKYRSDHDTFMYQIYSRLYSPHFPQSRYSKELWITKKNFKKVSRNKAVLFITKSLFNKLNEKGFDIDGGNSDIFRRIVYDLNCRILSHTDVNVQYIGDLKVKTNREIVENGYKWAKRYLKKFNIFSFLYYSMHLALLTVLIVYVNYALPAFLAFYIIFLTYLSDSKKDFWIMFRSAPGEIIRFYIGTIKFLTGRS
ncbi:MAG: glycosyltransferase [Candidatus Delongbacteria bacterium]|nr:glycosyltransferase [Candidatus Delongbacteria bacterium]MDD4206093.1 glycosyltransferase [Candidatus Delongbacteria bacterium]MDY0016643.1 glycosyltransferase [Candidatus Delongbacteria bacterium]